MTDDPQTIAEAEARLDALERERRRTLVTLERLRARAARNADEGDRLAGLMAPAEKLALFRRFFRGRDDVYPRLWENRRTAKKGYAPACANEWVRGVCEKPRVRCGACPSRAFLPLDDDVLLGHLRGKHVVGVYPLLSDETCWLLAADFDERTWRDDVRSFRDTCRDAGLTVTLERSRSGNGAHAWMFFAEPVAAAVARRMGCALLTATMSRRHAMSLASYDRFFPSQDTMPTGGFGNLIALPLQYEARKQGNTLFLDNDLEPLEDPWAYLSDLQPTPRAQVEEIAARAAREGRIVGLPVPSGDDEEVASPWTRSPSRARRRAKIEGPLPTRVTAVASQRLFVEKAGLPSPLLNEIKRLAAFQNPQFYERQGMRLSTALTPRVIGCAEESPLHIGLPRGCTESLGSLLAEHGVELRVSDERTEGAPLDVTFEGTLTALQQRAVAALLPHDHGVVVAPPGAGKTVLGIHLIARRARNTLVLVHRKPLLDQWRAQLALFLGVASKSIGRIGAGASRANGRLDVAMIQSLCRKGQVSDVVAQYGHVVVDECHHVSAISFERVLAETKARFVTGLTATLRRRDGHDPIVTMQCGPVRFRTDARDAGAVPSFPRWLHVQDTAFRIDPGIPTPGIQQLYGLLAADRARNELILHDVLGSIAEGRAPLVLTERRDHLDLLAGRLRQAVPGLVVLHGGLKARQRKEEMARLAALPSREPHVVLATGRYAGEGFDDPRLDTLHLALPVSWRGTLIQYAGRLHRRHADKTEVRIYDYADRSVPVLQRMFERRARGYRSMGYRDSDTETGPLLDGASRDEPMPREPAPRRTHRARPVGGGDGL
ncbi:MAG: DEAD/DEAH box helicase family protein [Planctomycetota bacterium]